MKRIFTLFFAAALSLTACAQFPYNTSTGQFSTAVSPSPRDFAWSWPSYADQQINVTFAATGMTTVIFRMASPNGGDAYLTVYGGTVISNLGNGYTRYTAIISRTNVPPARSYRGEFMAANQDGTNYTPTAILARGDITVQWSAFNATNQLVYTNTAVIYVSPLEITNIYIVGSAGTGAVTAVNNRQIGITFPSPSSATNGVNSATFNEGTTNGVTLAGNVLTVSFKTNYSGGTSGGITNIVNGSGLLVSGTDERTLTVTNSPLVGGLAATNFVLRTGDWMSGSLFLTNSGATASQIISYHSNAYAGFTFTGNGINPIMAMKRGSTNIWLAAVASNFVRTASGGLSPAYTIWDSGLDGSGSGLDADLLDGLSSAQILPAIATEGTGNAVTNLAYGGNVITQQLGTISGGVGASVPAIRWGPRFEAAAFGYNNFSAGEDLISSDTTTNIDSYGLLLRTASTTPVTGKIYFAWSSAATNATAKVKVSQAQSTVFSFALPNGAAVALTGLTNAATAVTSLVLTFPSGAATNGSLTFSTSTTNALNPIQIGVDL